MCSLDTFFPVNRLFRQKSFNNNMNKGNVFVFFHELLMTDFAELINVFMLLTIQFY